MSVELSDDLRHAVQAEGTPLKVVDPTTGETYLLVRESAFVKAQSSSADDEAALARSQISNARLLEIAKSHRPPRDWLEAEEDLF